MSLGYRVLRTTIIRFLGMVVFAVYWNFNGLCTKMIEKNNTCKTQKMWLIFKQVLIIFIFEDMRNYLIGRI